MHYMSLSFGVDTKIKRLINLFMRGRPIKTIKCLMPLTLSLTYQIVDRYDRLFQFTRSDINSVSTILNLFVPYEIYKWCNHRKFENRAKSTIKYLKNTSLFFLCKFVYYFITILILNLN